MTRSGRKLVILLGVLFAASVLTGLAILLAPGARQVALGDGWAVPILAGGGVGLLSWLLLSADSRSDSATPRRTMVRCTSCGMELLEDWRLCPFCGASGAEQAGPRKTQESSNA